MTYRYDERWPVGWQDLTPAEYPDDLPRELLQLDADGDPYNPIWCSVDIANEVFAPGTWAISPLWVPPAPNPAQE